MAHSLRLRMNQEPIAGDSFTITINNQNLVFNIIAGSGDIDSDPFSIGVDYFSGQSQSYLSRIADWIDVPINDYTATIVNDNFAINNFGTSDSEGSYIEFFIETVHRTELNIDSFSSNRSYITGELIGGNSTGSDGVNNTFDIDPPIDLILSSRNDSSISIQWNEPQSNSDIIGYEVYRNNELLIQTVNTNFSDEGLIPDTEYTYTVASRAIVNGLQYRSRQRAVLVVSTLELGQGENDIVIEQGLQDFYPLHNDSFLKYRYKVRDFSVVTGISLRSNISIMTENGDNIGNGFFVIFSDLKEVFCFNFKESIKYLLFDKFAEDEFVDIDGFTKKLQNVIRNVKVGIGIQGGLVNGNFLVNAYLERNFSFKNSLIQVGKKVFDNPYQLLYNSEDGVRYYKTYFEGFPFNLDIQNDGNENIRILNNSNGDKSVLIDSLSISRRFVVDSSGGDNWNSNKYLILKDGENELSFEIDGENKTSLILNKKRISKGVLLRWWNGDGSYSSWLFERYYRNDVKVNSLNKFTGTEFNNVGNLNAVNLTSGNAASKSVRLKTKVNRKEFKELESLFISPKVQYYTSEEADIEGDFVDVRMDQNYKYYNKKSVNILEINIDLPELITAKI